jgi:Na+-translocating ferredoxin:NAD+ oxidoreductase RnfC subunit
MLTFPGGAHPPEHKDATGHKPIESPPLPAKAFVLMSQHIGAPSKPVVEKGTVVKTGPTRRSPARSRTWSKPDTRSPADR